MNTGQIRNDLIVWLLIDGLGLCLIVACTILDAIYTFNQYLLSPLLGCFAIENVNEFNREISLYVHHRDDIPVASFFWVAGRTLQVAGLLLLILYAATFNYSIELDRAGMLFLTIGPLLNMGACTLLSAINLEAREEKICDGQVGELLLRPSWTCTEMIEIFGILWLDFSMIDGLDELWVMTAEIIGFLVLIGAAQFDYYFLPRYTCPIIVIRSDMMHLYDTIGLCLLILVSIAHYISKLNLNLHRRLHFVNEAS